MGAFARAGAAGRDRRPPQSVPSQQAAGVPPVVREPHGPLTAADVLSLQRLVGNQAVTALIQRSAAGAYRRGSTGTPAAQPVVQRQLAWDGKTQQLSRSGRYQFDAKLAEAMRIGPNEARCHTISYEYIVSAVMDPINSAVEQAAADKSSPGEFVDDPSQGVAFYLNGIVKAVFPGGGAAKPTYKKIGAEFYAAAVQAVAGICAALKAEPFNGVALATKTNDLIYALNNSPDNLRPGNDSTNSSIKQALDMGAQKATLKATDRIVTGHPERRPKRASKATDVLLVDGAYVPQLHTLLTETYTKDDRVNAFSSGSLIQESGQANMTAASMTDTNPVPIAYLIPKTKNTYFLFDV